MAEDLLTITPDLNEQPKTPVVPTVAVDAPDTLVPAELQTDLDYSETHSSKVDNREAEMLRNRILSRAEQRKGKKEQDAPPGMTKENVASLFTDGPAGLEEFHTVGGGAAAQTRFRNVAADVGEGLVEAPGAVIGGAIDAVNSTIQLVDDLSAWVEKQFSDAPGKEELSEEERARREKKVAEGKVPAGVIREEGIDLTEAAPQLPNLPEPDTTTGQMTRAVAAFMTDFFLIGKAAPGLKAAKGAPLLTRIGKDAVRGALADFAGPVYEQRLSTLANQFPILGEIVPDYLAGDPNDTQLEKRFKNAIEGAGLGVVADGFITAVKAVRSSRIAKAKMQEAGLTPPAPKTAQNLEALGKAQDDILSTEVKVKPLGVEHPLEPTVDRLANIEQQIKVPPLYPRIERIATKDQVKEVVNQTIKDYPGEKRQLFRAVFEDDLKLKPGVLPANPKGHQTAKGENVVGTWWTTSLDDAVNTLKPGKEVRGGDRKVIIVAMDADSLPPQAYIQNATAADDMAFAWIGVPADVPTSQLKKVDISEDVAKIATKGEDDVTRGIAKDDVGRVGKAAGREGVSEPAAAGAGRAEESTAADIAAVAADGRDGGAVAFNPLDEAAPGEIRVNFSRIEAPEDVKQILQDMVDAKGATIQEARRGVRSWEETKLSADQLDAWKTLQERTPQGAFNAEQSVAVRELWVQSGSKLKEITDVAAAAPTEENLFLFRKMLATHQLIQKEAIAARTETARALNAWRIPAGGGAEQFRHIEGVLDQFGGKETSEQLLAKYKSLSDAGYERELVDFVEKSALAKSSDVVAQVWINSLLSSPHTHVRNIISQTAVLAQLVSERKAASVISEFRDATDGVVSGEAYQMVLGLVDGLKDSFRVTAKGRQLAKSATKKALDRDFAGAKEVLAESPEEFGTVLRSAATGETGIGIGKVELPREGALNAEALGIKNPGLSNVFDLLDTATQLPGRALAISDEFFKTSGYRMELRAQALRQATDEIEQGVIKQDALKDRMAQLINDPPEKLRLAASDTALAATFTGKPAE
ncbi:MAG: hypothetical protein KAT00_05805, partial [Planctomycetes bacterium]|nr:hypothetical protein [Planctomycetota bacterium]